MVNMHYTKANWDNYTYPTAVPWKKMGTNAGDDFTFLVAPGNDCVVLVNTGKSASHTRFFRDIASFVAMRDNLERAMSQVVVWNDMDIPQTLYSLPVSPAMYMGSLRLYVRVKRDGIRLSKKHCEQLLYMYNRALEDLEHWNTHMAEIFGDDIPKIPYNKVENAKH